MTKRSKQSDQADDEELFLREMTGVKRLMHTQTPVKPVRRTPPVLSKQHEEDERNVESGDVLRFLRPGMQKASLLKLRRGQIPVEATLDLHGHTAAEATQQLQRFIKRAQARSIRAVRIIHGKGHGSAGAPVLKTKVDEWLRKSEAILAFCSAQPANGGTGAVEVLLRR